MSKLYLNSSRRAPIDRLTRSIAVAGVSVVLSVCAACAPDAVQNYAATGFNGYLRTLQNSCGNLLIGSSNVGQWLRDNGSADPNYTYWIDMTSRLYYNRISAAEYQSSITGFMGSGSSNAQSFDCILRNLPLQRPEAPPPRMY